MSNLSPSLTRLHIDVENIGKWGINLDHPHAPVFFGAYDEMSGPYNAWNYIDHFGRHQDGVANPDAGHPWPGMDTPIFWETWIDTTINSVPEYEPRTDLLSDWEWELLNCGPYGTPIFNRVAQSYGMDLFDLNPLWDQ